MQPIAGSLLIASATLADPNFARCVILVVDSDANGSLGLVLNRPTDTPVGEVLDQWQDMTTEPDVLFRGGPVELNAALALGSLRAAPPPSGWQPLTGLRVYAGYTGWGANQLADEIEVGSWHVVPATETDLFSSAPDRLWGDVLRRQPPPLSMLATLPADANLN
jgi:putative transcriptional regulator